jgi:hypothetical protein
MYRTAAFTSTLEDGPVFEDDEQVAPGGRALTQAIVDRLRGTMTSVSDVDQHEYYGWSFSTETGDASYYNVLCPAGDECYLTVSMDWYVFKLLLLRRPKASFEHYCMAVKSVVESISGVSGVVWQDYRS